jgi:hypothetical protein
LIDYNGWSARLADDGRSCEFICHVIGEDV